MIVYRVVDRYFNGYKNRLAVNGTESLDSVISNTTDLPYDKNYEINRPLPENDGLLSFPESYIFGFTKIDDYKNWFNLHQRNAGADCGGKICVYAIDDKHVLKGNKQCCFDPDHAYMINYHPMNYFDSDADKCIEYPKWEV